MAIIRCTIEKFSKKGHGIGTFMRQDGMVCSVEVPFCIPGDEVQVELLSKKSGVYQSILQNILHPSADRITPRCVHFGTCGGCRWQQIFYAHQLRLKQQRVLGWFGELITPEVQVGEILPSPEAWQYRNKMEFTFSADKSGSRYLGLIMQRGKGRVLDLKECHLANPWMLSCLNAARSWWEESGLTAYNPRNNQGSLQTLTLREGFRTGDRLINLTVSGNPDFALKKEQLNHFVTAMRAIEGDKPAALFLTIKQAMKGHPTRFFEMHLGGPDHIQERLAIQSDPKALPKWITFKISSSAFFQPNPLQAERLYNAMLHLAEIPENAVVYDLYCGTGTLGICTAARAKQVVGIEISREACLDARENIASNGLSHVTILTGCVYEKLSEIKAQNSYPPPDVVVLDPPRAGLEAKAIACVGALGAHTIAYISCNPETQAQNIRELVHYGYQLVAVQPVDQFPQTVHIENIAILKKGSI